MTKSSDTKTSDTGPVANPPAGGNQAFASTNDDNQNTVLQTAPTVVVSSANRQAGVVSRFADAGAANNDAAARRKALDNVGNPAGTKFTVMAESDLPDFVAKVEAGESV